MVMHAAFNDAGLSKGLEVWRIEVSKIKNIKIFIKKTFMRQ